MTDAERCGVVGYLGHDPELLSDSIRNNILLGRDDDAWKYLWAVCLEDEVKAMPNGLDTRVGDGGVRLSGGQQQRLALARTLAHPRPLLVLDDPFSALDRKTEEQVFDNLRKMTAGSTVLLISHRLYLFPQMDGVLWIQDGKAVCAAHEELIAQNPQYAALVNAQEGGEQDEPEKMRPCAALCWVPCAASRCFAPRWCWPWPVRWRQACCRRWYWAAWWTA